MLGDKEFTLSLLSLYPSSLHPEILHTASPRPGVTRCLLSSSKLQIKNWTSVLLESVDTESKYVTALLEHEPIKLLLRILLPNEFVPYGHRTLLEHVCIQSIKNSSELGEASLFCII